MVKAVRLDKVDNVAVVAQDTSENEVIEIDNTKIIATQNIPAGHKVAVSPIEKNQLIFKYGVPIGKASESIIIGEHVHTQNTIDITSELCIQYEKKFKETGDAIE